MTSGSARVSVRLFQVLIAISLGSPNAGAQTGLLVVAHGANATWNARVREVVAEVKWNGPIAMAFLMGPEADSSGWNAAVTRLVAAGAKEIIAVPLMVSSHGGHYRQVRFMAGELQEWPPDLPAHNHDSVGAPPVPVRVTAALDGAPELGEAIRGRWRALDPEDRRRPLLLVAHGPSTDEEAGLWIRDLDQAASGIRLEGRIPVAIGLLRDDAAPPVRAAAIAEIHKAVRELAGRAGDSVTAMPVLISSGSINTVTIPKDLDGLPVRYTPAALSPWPSLARWIERVALAKTPPAQ